MDVSQMLTHSPLMVAGVIPAASIFAAVLLTFAACAFEQSRPAKYFSAT